MTRLAVRTVMQAAAVLKHKSDEGGEMYSTKSLNGVPTIQRNGLKAMDRAFGKVHHA
jgi:hypothetical protein